MTAPLFVDRREDADVRGRSKRSADIARFVPASMIEVIELDAGDVAFAGQGPDGAVSIGIEIKTLPDLIQSIDTNRFTGHQLPLLHENYHIPWLLIEGQWRAAADGTIEVLKEPKPVGLQPGKKTRTAKWYPLHGRAWKWKEVRNWLTTMEMHGGVRVVMTRDRIETARWCAAMWEWWLKDWGMHKSHLALKSQPFVGPLRHATLVEKLALQIPGLGQHRARLVGASFGSPAEMFAADVARWDAIEGIGKTIAENVWNALHGEGAANSSTDDFVERKMPFKSEEQRRWMHANKPALARKWEEEEARGEPAVMRLRGASKKSTPSNKPSKASKPKGKRR